MEFWWAIFCMAIALTLKHIFGESGPRSDPGWRNRPFQPVSRHNNDDDDYGYGVSRAVHGAAIGGIGFFEDDSESTENIDETYMFREIDIQGNSFDSTEDSGPSVNIDVTPMIGSVDIYGNPYGVTNDDHDFGGTSGFSSFGTDDSFGSSYSSSGSYDDH